MREIAASGTAPVFRLLRSADASGGGAGRFVGPGNVMSLWQVGAAGPGVVLPEESERAKRLLGD